ncbi:MAG: hypothetical protein H0W76_09705 [Pyrinomonadaceae bacterium]|nr:hypothetical protein [Pyrinomonadaceae bacterium]
MALSRWRRVNRASLGGVYDLDTGRVNFLSELTPKPHHTVARASPSRAKAQQARASH